MHVPASSPVAAKAVGLMQASLPAPRTPCPSPAQPWGSFADKRVVGIFHEVLRVQCSPWIQISSHIRLGSAWLRLLRTTGRRRDPLGRERHAVKWRFPRESSVSHGCQARASSGSVQRRSVCSQSLHRGSKHCLGSASSSLLRIRAQVSHECWHPLPSWTLPNRTIQRTGDVA